MLRIVRYIRKSVLGTLMYLRQQRSLSEARRPSSEHPVAPPEHGVGVQVSPAATAQGVHAGRHANQGWLSMFLFWESRTEAI